MMVDLETWAKAKFQKPPGLQTLRRMARDGEITPAPIKVGRGYQVDESAKLTAEVGRASLVQRLR